MELFDPSRDPRADLAQARSAAATDGKDILLVFGARWCPDCTAFEDWTADPEVAELLAVVETQRLTGARMLVRWLRDHGGLRRGLSPERAAQICWTQSDPAIYRRLVVGQGWTSAQYRRYVVDVVRATVLPD